MPMGFDSKAVQCQKHFHAQKWYADVKLPQYLQGTNICGCFMKKVAQNNPIILLSLWDVTFELLIPHFR